MKIHSRTLFCFVLFFFFLLSKFEQKFIPKVFDITKCPHRSYSSWSFACRFRARYPNHSTELLIFVAKIVINYFLTVHCSGIHYTGTGVRSVRSPQSSSRSPIPRSNCVVFPASRGASACGGHSILKSADGFHHE